MKVTALHRDVGFVQRGMRAIIKLKTQPVTHYDSPAEMVKHTSPCSTLDERRGLVLRNHV